MRRALTAIAAAALVTLGIGIAPARAQVPPPPEQATPVLELIAPTVSPVCGDAILAVTLAPVLLGGQGVPVPVDALPVFGPAFIVCGSIPAPPQRLTCAPDVTIRGPIDTATGTAAGTALPLDTSIFGPLVEQEFVLEDTLGAPVNSAGLGSTIAGTLTCTVIASPKAEEPAPAPDDQSDVSADEVTEPDLGIPDLGAPGVDYNALGATAPTETQLGSAAAPITPIAGVGGPGFAYPVVFVAPLLLLALVGYFGWVLNRPALSSGGTPRARNSSAST